MKAENKIKGLILAAGLGSRLGNLTSNRPKCLIEVNGVTILENCINAFINNGICKISIIVGYLQEKIREFIDLKFPHHHIEFIENKYFETTGTSFSLSLGLEKTEEKLPTLIIEGDVFFDQKLIKDLIDSSPNTDRTAIASYTAEYSGTFVELNENGQIKNWLHESVRMKNYPIENLYKTVNITLLNSIQSVDIFQRTLQEIIKKYGQRAPSEYAFHKYINSYLNIIYGYKVGKTKWFEIDTEDDLLIANKIFIEVSKVI